MRIYFLSERTAGLKLNGAYMGIIDGFERFVDADISQKILAEVFPGAGFTAVSFFIDGDFFDNPPAFTDVYLLEGGDAVIYLHRFAPAGGKLEVIKSAQFCGIAITLFNEGGGVYLHCAGEHSALYELSRGFANANLSEAEIGGYKVLLVEGEGCLAIISDKGKRIFYNPAASWQCGNTLKAEVNFCTCAGCYAVCDFAYDGQEMRLVNSRTLERYEIDKEVLHFAFFESVLTHGDFTKYLSDDLKEHAADMYGYLGEFIDVTVPYKKFFEKHGDIKAAGLIYPIKENLFKVKYYAVEFENGKISNVYQVIE